MRKLLLAMIAIGFFGCELPTPVINLSVDDDNADAYFSPAVSIEYLFNSNDKYQYFSIQIFCGNDRVDKEVGDLEYNITYDAVVAIASLSNPTNPVKGVPEYAESLSSFDSSTSGGITFESSPYLSKTFYVRVPYSAFSEGVAVKAYVEVDIAGTVTLADGIAHDIGPFTVSDSQGIYVY